MGVLEDITRRMSPASWYPTYGADLEPVTEYTAEGVPVTSLKKKSFSDPYAAKPKGETPIENVAVPAPAPPPLAALGQQAGIIAPEMGQGGLPAGFGQMAPPPAAPVPPEPNPGPVAPGAVPLPMARPGAAPAPPTEASSVNRSPVAPVSPIDAIAPQTEAAPVAPAGGGSPFQLPSILDKIRTTMGDNSNALLAIGAGFAGAPNWGQAISRAASAAIPARNADIKQKLMQQTQGTGYQALVDAGVPKNLAVAAMGNPAIMKSVTENYLGDRKGQLTDIGFDRYGNPIKGVFDPYTKKITPLAAATDATAATAPAPRTAANAAAAIARKSAPAEPDPALPGREPSTDVSSAGRVSGANPAAPGSTATPVDNSGGVVTAENDVTGPDYLEHLKETDPQYARQVEQIVNGDAPMPTGRLASTPVGRKLRQDVLSVEPGLSDADFATRQQVRKDYLGGNSGKVTKSINTTLHHAHTLEKAINDLDNFSGIGSMLNTPRDMIKSRTSEDYQKAKGAYDTAVANFAKELDFAVSGGRPTVSGTKHQMEGFDRTAPKAEQMSKLREGIDLLNGRLESHAEGYSRGMKKNAEAMDFIEPRNKKFFQRITGTEAPAAAAPAAPVAPAAPPVASKAEYDALAPGATYTAPDGSVRTKK